LNVEVDYKKHLKTLSRLFTGFKVPDLDQPQNPSYGLGWIEELAMLHGD
jgi:hypothetical protein